MYFDIVYIPKHFTTSAPPDCHDINFFKCNVSGRCIPIDYLCDDIFDCGEDDYSDENNLYCNGVYFNTINFHIMSITYSTNL